MRLSLPHRMDRVRDLHEIDVAFLRWLETKLASSHPDASEEDVINYLIALALGGRSQGERAGL
jgi:hypothetical protein